MSRSRREFLDDTNQKFEKALGRRRDRQERRDERFKNLGQNQDRRDDDRRRNRGRKAA